MLRLFLRCVCWFLVLLALGTGVVDLFVSFNAHRFIVSIGEVTKHTVAIVPGAGAKGGVPSDVFRDRLLTATELYHEGMVEKILVSGDHGTASYDEVNTARLFLLGQQVAEEDIFLDHAGFDTYDTMWRARHVFGVQDAIIVTQAFHLGRCVYLARTLGMDVLGVPADKQHYVDALRFWVRERFARDKAVLNVLFGPRTTVGGEEIPIEGDGRATWDQGLLPAT